MRIIIIVLALTCFLGLNVNAQKYMTKTGVAYFKSHTDVIDIDGTNNKVAAILDASNGEFVAIVLIKAFVLPLATADKHFNETYMESDKFPKAVFKGKIVEIPTMDLSLNGEYDVTAEGQLTIHGETHAVKQTGILKVENNELSGSCTFNVAIDDFKIEVPKDVKERVAKNVDVKIEATLKLKQ